jgi:uncharacterized protein (TIGR02466 family)
MHIRPEFAVPTVWSTYERASELNSKLADYFLKKEKIAGMANPNPYTHRGEGLFESRFDLFHWNEEPIIELRTFCFRVLTELVAGLNGYSSEDIARLRIGADAWFHITRKGSHFGIHNHPMASWSGVYCVSPGTPSNQFDDGALTFINPFIMATSFVDPGNARMHQPYSHGSNLHKLEAGQLVLFPSWLLHEVKVYNGDSERITVAFNSWFFMDKAL